jgi:hypothetical protein
MPLGRGASVLFAGVVIFMASACTDLPPTETAIPFNVPSDRKDIVSVCYDAGGHSRAEVEAVAMSICGKKTAAVTPWRVDKVLNDCPMFKKTRASFVCVPLQR